MVETSAVAVELWE
jgi:hypothetical protein